MNFDINSVLNDMKNAASKAIQDNIENIPEYLKQIFENEKHSLKKLAEARLKNEITDEIFKNELEREKKVLEAEMLTIEIMSKALAQKAINAAMNVLINAIKIAI